MLSYFFGSEDGGNIFIRNVGWLSTDLTTLHSRRLICSKVLLFEQNGEGYYRYPVQSCAVSSCAVTGTMISGADKSVSYGWRQVYPRLSSNNIQVHLRNLRKLGTLFWDRARRVFVVTHSLSSLVWMNMWRRKQGGSVGKWRPCTGSYIVPLSLRPLLLYSRGAQNIVVQLYISGLFHKFAIVMCMLAGSSPVQVPDEVYFFFNLPNPSSRTMALGSTQPLTEMSTRNFPGGKKRPALRADNLAAIYEPNVWKCANLNLPRPYGPPRPVTGINLLYLCYTEIHCCSLWWFRLSLFFYLLFERGLILFLFYLFEFRCYTVFFSEVRIELARPWAFYVISREVT
jgi:hypothetical protein